MCHTPFVVYFQDGLQVINKPDGWLQECQTIVSKMDAGLLMCRMKGKGYQPAGVEKQMGISCCGVYEPRPAHAHAQDELRKKEG